MLVSVAPMIGASSVSSPCSYVRRAAGPQLRIFIDADACPVKDEVYRVAARHGLTVFVVANNAILIPRTPGIERGCCRRGARTLRTSWIAERAGPGAIVVTADIPLASGCVKSGRRRHRCTESDLAKARLAWRCAWTTCARPGRRHGAQGLSAPATVQIA